MLIVSHIFPSLILSEGAEEVNHNDKDDADDNTGTPPTTMTTTTTQSCHPKRSLQQQRRLLQKSKTRMIRSRFFLPSSCLQSPPSQSRWLTPSPSRTTQTARTTMPRWWSVWTELWNIVSMRWEWWKMATWSCLFTQSMQGCLIKRF